MTKIVSLAVSNIKRLSAVHIEPDGSLVVIGGKNGQGKTSVLDSIMYALAGGDSIPSKPLRTGTSKGQAVVTLDDGLKITRKFSRTQEGELTTSLEIKRANGDRVSSPQALLDTLCGRMAFDPLEFSRLKPKAQLDALKELVGLDFSELDGQRQAAFQARTNVNRAVKAKAAQFDAAGPAVDPEPQEVSVATLADKLADADKQNQENGRIRATIADVQARAAEARAEVQRLQKEIARLNQYLADAVTEADEAEREYAATRERAESLKDADTASIREEIRQAESVNHSARKAQQRRKLVSDLDALKGDADKLTEAIEAIDRQKQEAMAEAKFPVAGLGFDDGGITFNELPFEQSSSAEMLRVSTAMGLALNPKLPVMLIRDGSLLDTDSLAMVAQMAEERGAQVWIERVGDGAEVSVLIEDGAVAGQVLAGA